MLEILDSGLDGELVKKVFGDAISGEFMKTIAIFGFAAWIHGKQVSKAISTKFDELVYVLKKDLEAQQSVLGKLALRVDNIESTLKLRSDK